MTDKRTADDIVTALNNSPTRADANALMLGVGPKLVRAVADLLYVEADGHAAPWLRNAIVSEARGEQGDELVTARRTRARR
jgi:hypothetical protein